MAKSPRMYGGRKNRSGDTQNIQDAPNVLHASRVSHMSRMCPSMRPAASAVATGAKYTTPSARSVLVTDTRATSPNAAGQPSAITKRYGGAAGRTIRCTDAVRLRVVTREIAATEHCEDH